MNIPFNPGDVVLTKIQGQDVEAVVVQIAPDLKLKTVDGRLYWRAISRVRLANDPIPESDVAGVQRESDSAEVASAQNSPNPGIPLEPEEVGIIHTPAPSAPKLKGKRKARKRGMSKK